MNYLYKNISFKKVFNYLLVVIAMFPLLGMRIVVYIIGIWCLVALISIIKHKVYRVFSFDRKELIILCSHFLLMIIFFLFTEDTTEALKNIERKVSFIIFPTFLFLAIDLFEKKTIKRVLFAFLSSNVILAIYIWFLILNKGFIHMLQIDNHYNPVFRNIFSKTTGIHLPYLGLLYGFSGVILMHYLSTLKLRIITKILMIFLMIFLLFSMIIFSARMAIFAFIAAMSYYLFTIISRRNATIIIAFILLSITALSFLPPIKRRVQEITEMKFVLPNKEQKSDNVNFRYAIYFCSLETIKENWLLGLGLGSVQKELDKCYKRFDYNSNFDDFAVKQYNSHNQYLNEWMTYGIIGLFSILFFLFYCFKNNDLLYRSFLIMIMLALLTENLFEREIGIVFFTFFNTLFFVRNRKKAERTSDGNKTQNSLTL